MTHKLWWGRAVRAAIALVIVAAAGAALANPRMGWAREGQTNADDGPVAIESVTEVGPLTDHPEGKSFGAPPEAPVVRSNADQPARAAVTSASQGIEMSNARVEPSAVQTGVCESCLVPEPGR